MRPTEIKTWQAVQDEVLRRIHAREWKPGDLIPAEADLATEFGCARATVNRALQALAEAGTLDRRRKAGTRVALHPVAKATLDIHVIRREIEARGQRYGYLLVKSAKKTAPPAARARLGVMGDTKLMHLRALHMADSQPFVVEDRWINLDAVPAAKTADFEELSANEWLLLNVPYTHGDIAFSAREASRDEADAFDVDAGAALFTIDRTTWDHETAITTVRLTYRPGYSMQTSI